MTKLLVFLKGIQLGLNYVITTLESNEKKENKPKEVDKKESKAPPRKYSYFPKDKEYLLIDAANPRTDLRKRRFKYILQEVAPFSQAALRAKLKKEGYYIDGGVICK